MASNSETGHAVNIANFRTMIDHCVALGGAYIPSNAALAVTNLNSLWNTGKTAHDALLSEVSATKHPINTREELFKPLEKLVTRTLNYYYSTGATDAAKQDAKGLADAIRGTRVRIGNDADGNPLPDDVSNSHLSYVQRTNNFKQLVSLYENDAAHYAPTDDDLSAATLRSLADAMQAKNDEIAGILAPVRNARDRRNNHLYGDGGMVACAALIKKYCKSLPETHAEVVRNIIGLKFTPLKRR